MAQLGGLAIDEGGAGAADAHAHGQAAEAFGAVENAAPEQNPDSPGRWRAQR